MKFDDAVWDVIKDTIKLYKDIEPDENIRQIIEEYTIITPFEGGVFVANENEFDLFVIPEKRGKWGARGKLKKYLGFMLDKYGSVIVKIHQDNKTSLRLAKGFGFKEIETLDNIVKLELTKWK